MNQRSFARKLIYLALVAVLLVPLSLLSQPATVATGPQASAGGILAQQRDRYQLGQANLGKIDPASETIKLATLGMRGVAATILWNQAHEYQKKEDWTKLGATLDQIANLQPNYVGVWRHQAWNLSYNVSAEFDDYRDRYYWVIEGLKYLQEGASYNRNSPEMLSDIGWFSVQKLGRSDEHLQFRELFRADDDFHAQQAVKQRDSWLFGKAYYREAQRLVDNLGIPIHTSAPAIFHSQAPMAQINYAVALEEEGVFGRLARAAWQQALDEWQQFGQRELPAPYGGTVRLVDLPADRERLTDLLAQLDALEPGLRNQIYTEKVAALPDEQRRAMRTPADARSAEEQRLANLAQIGTAVTDAEVAQRVEEANRSRAEDLAGQIVRLRLAIAENTANREHLNYDGWTQRCEMELRDEALEARQLLWEASDALTTDADLWTAREKFERGFVLFQELFEQYPEQAQNEPAFQVYEWIKQYEETLEQLDQPFPEDFPLAEIRQYHKMMEEGARSGFGLQ